MPPNIWRPGEFLRQTLPGETLQFQCAEVFRPRMPIPEGTKTIPEAVAQKINHLPDPILAAEGLHCKPFPEVYGTPTTE